MRALRLLHRWFGLALAAILAVVGLSGSLLLLKGPYYRALYPSLARPVTTAQADAYPGTLEAIEASFGEALTLVKFPQPGMNAFQIWLRDGREGFIEPGSGAIIAMWTWAGSLPAFLFELHAHLLAEDAGSLVNGVTALGGGFLVLTGILLWWPRRVTAFRLRFALPREASSASLLRSHAAVGAVSAVPVLVFVATGAAIVFYDRVETVVTAVLDSRPAEKPSARLDRKADPRQSWSVLLPVLSSTLPSGPAVFYYPGTGANAALTFRKRLPGEWHPNGRSYVLIDPYTATVLQTIDARAQGLGTRAMFGVYPVHAAMVGGAPMTAAAAVSGLALGWLGLSGLCSYLRAWRARRRVRVPDPQSPQTAPETG